MSDKQKSKKIILPPKSKTPSYKKSDIVLLPELEAVLTDAASIVSTELAKLRRRSEIGSTPMDNESARVLQGYIKSAIDLSKENRERDKESNTDNLSDTEVLNMFLENLPKEEVVRLLQDTLNKDTSSDE
jgi:hypothetical protein